MDAVAGAVLDLVVSDESAPSVVNVVHPRPVPWSTVLKGVRGALRSPIPLVPYHEWLAKLEEAALQPTSAQLEAVVSQLLCMARVSSDVPDSLRSNCSRSSEALEREGGTTSSSELKSSVV